MPSHDYPRVVYLSRRDHIGPPIVGEVVEVEDMVHVRVVHEGRVSDVWFDRGTGRGYGFFQPAIGAPHVGHSVYHLADESLRWVKLPP